MTDRPMFHLALPVADLAAAERFYVGVLGARVGRANAEWLDILLWGHQITLHHRPTEVLPANLQGKRHFGVVLPWGDWEQLAAELRDGGQVFLAEPTVSRAGTPEEQAKFHLADPSNNIIEIKAYREVEAVFGRTRLA